MILTHGLLAGQVLQRRADGSAVVLVQGKCLETGKVTAAIRKGRGFLKGWKNRVVGNAAKGKFTVRLKGIPLGGPYEITLRVKSEAASVAGIWVGDVWLLAGQSNMQGCGLLSQAPAPHPKVHARYMDGHWDVAREPIHAPMTSLHKAHWSLYSSVRPTKSRQRQLLAAQSRMVGPAVFFGKEMVKRSGGAPQGFLCTAIGGTSMERWSPAKKNLGGDSLYGAMLATWRETGQPVAGILWYQGESDAPLQKTAAHYTRRMKQFVAALRRDLGQPAAPFFLVQLGKVFNPENEFKFWNSIQDQQLRLKKSIRHFDVVSAIDLPMEDRIHIGTAGYVRLGVRLARLADRLVYGHRHELSAPEVASIRRAPTKETRKNNIYRVEVKFKNVVGGLRGGHVPSGFAFIDEKQKDTPSIYKISLQGNRAYVEIPGLPKNDRLRLAYGVGLCPYCNITDARDMPVPVFGPSKVK